MNLKICIYLELQIYQPFTAVTMGGDINMAGNSITGVTGISNSSTITFSPNSTTTDGLQVTTSAVYPETNSGLDLGINRYK